MKIINYSIYSYIIGDSFGLSLLNCDNNKGIVGLKYNDSLNIEKGYFSYMSTFMLCVMDSLSINKKLDIVDVTNKMCTSLIVGKYTNCGKVYNLNKSTLNFLEYYIKKNNFDYNYNFDDLNGDCLSRIVPLILYSYYKSESFEDIIKLVSITNINEVVLLGCYIYYKYVINILEGYDKYKALKIDIPKYFSKKCRKYYKDLLKEKIYYKDIKYDDNIINILNIVFYVILNSENFDDMFNMISNLDGNVNIYSSLICFVGGILYGKNNIPKNLLKDLKNKRDINLYIKKFERMFL